MKINKKYLNILFFLIITILVVPLFASIVEAKADLTSSEEATIEQGIETDFLSFLNYIPKDSNSSIYQYVQFNTTSGTIYNTTDWTFEACNYYLWAYWITGESNYRLIGTQILEHAYSCSVNGIITKYNILSNTVVPNNVVTLFTQCQYALSLFQAYSLSHLQDSTLLTYALNATDSTIMYYMNSTTFLFANTYNPITKVQDTGAYCSSQGAADQLLGVAYYYTNNNTYLNDIVNNLHAFQDSITTYGVPYEINVATGAIIAAYQRNILGDLIDWGISAYQLTGDSAILTYMDDFTAELVHHSWNATLGRFVYSVSASGQIDRAGYARYEYCAIQACAIMAGLTGNDTYLTYAQTAYNTMQTKGVYNGLQIVTLDKNNAITDYTSMYMGDNKDFCTATAMLYQVTGNKTYKDILLNFVSSSESLYKTAYGFKTTIDARDYSLLSAISDSAGKQYYCRILASLIPLFSNSTSNTILYGFTEYDALSYPTTPHIFALQFQTTPIELYLLPLAIIIAGIFMIIYVYNSDLEIFQKIIIMAFIIMLIAVGFGASIIYIFSL